MKHILSICALALTVSLVSCGSAEKTAEKKDVVQKEKVVSKVVEQVSNNKIEHDIIIEEPKFNLWLSKKAKPKGDYDQKHLESTNFKYVKEWNARVLQPEKYSSNLYESKIAYSETMNYGYDLNYQLFNYFIYFQNKYNQNLLGGTVPTN